MISSYVSSLKGGRQLWPAHEAREWSSIMMRKSSASGGTRTLQPFQRFHFSDLISKGETPSGKVVRAGSQCHRLGVEPQFLSAGRITDFSFEEQFDGVRKAAYILAEKTQQLAERDSLSKAIDEVPQGS